jgi:hypothetical protein
LCQEGDETDSVSYQDHFLHCGTMVPETARIAYRYSYGERFSRKDGKENILRTRRKSY